MKLEQLENIKKELNKFQSKLTLAIDIAKQVKGFKDYEGKLENVGDISNTTVLDRLKHAAFDFRNFLNREL